MPDILDRHDRLAPSLFDERAQQAVFRNLMQAYAFPGIVQTLPHNLGALQACLVCLVDAQTSLADPCDLLSPIARQQLECSIVPAEEALYVVAEGGLAPSNCLPNPKRGNLTSPELSATVFIRVDQIENSKTPVDGSFSLEGPGIDGPCYLWVEGLDPGWFQARERWNADFPMGVDFLLTCRDRLLALPRTTQVRRVN